jgi:leucyl aminopeptidase (aminopeptidase T)
MYGPPEVTEPPRPVVGALKQSDAALLIGMTVLLWIEAVQESLKSGRSGGSEFPWVSEDNFYRCMKIDYAGVWKTTKRVQSYFSKGRVAEITSPQSTNLVLEIGYPLLFEKEGSLV